MRTFKICLVLLSFLLAPIVLYLLWSFFYIVPTKDKPWKNVQAVKDHPTLSCPTLSDNEIARAQAQRDASIMTLLAHYSTPRTAGTFSEIPCVLTLGGAPTGPECARYIEEAGEIEAQYQKETDPHERSCLLKSASPLLYPLRIAGAFIIDIVGAPLDFSQMHLF